MKGGKSRSQCQNLGVKYATGDILLFLHADTILPNNYGHLIRLALQSNINYCIISNSSILINSNKSF